MDELEISGKRYISARRAAKENRYHSDYIGQLIRGKKIVGQKVGRAWYVEEESLNRYLGKLLPPPEPMVATEAEVVDAPAVEEQEVTAEVSGVEDTAEEKVEEVLPHVLSVEEDAVVTEASAEEVQDTNDTEAAVEEIKIKEEEVPVAVTRINDTEMDELEEVHAVPLKKSPIPQVFPVQFNKQAGLTYLQDEESLLPSIGSKEETLVEAPVHTQDKPSPRATKSKNFVGPLVGLALLAMFSFVAAAGTSYLLVHKTVVVGEEATAGVSFALPEGI